MDPLSLAASIIAVVEVSNVLLLCCYRLRGKVMGADDEIARIIAGVEDLSVTLTGLDDLAKELRDNEPLVQALRLSKEKDTPPPWKPALDSCNAVLSDISVQLGPLAKPGLRSRLQWPFESKSIGEKLELLEKHKSTLQLTLIMLQARIAAETHTRVTGVEQSIAGVGQSVIGVEQSIIGVEQSIAGVGQSITGVEQSIAGVEHSITGVEQSIAGVRQVVIQGNACVTESVDRQGDQERRADVLRWFKTSDPEQNHRVSREKHEPNTATWILESDVFQSWAAADGGATTSIWLHGIPGAGKTILTSTIIDHLQQRYGGDARRRVVYYYFDFSDTKKQTVAAFLQSAIYQLISDSESLPEAAAALFKARKDGLEQPTVGELLDLFSSLASSAQTVHLAIDALDECPSQQRELFFDAFLGPLQISGRRILITSRRERDIEDALAPVDAPAPVFHAIGLRHSDVDADVRTHVSNTIARDKTLNKWKPVIQQEILEAIVEGSHGMFRWAVCQLDTIHRCLTPAMVRAELKTLPQTLHETYDRILLSVDQLHQPFVRSALRWLAFSARRLTLPELSEACAIDPAADDFDPELVRLNDDSTILELCGALVTSTVVKRSLIDTVLGRVR